MKTFIVPFTALALLVGAPATARDLVVDYQDLDLSNPKAQKTLERRINHAAREYCGMDVQVTGSRTKGAGAGECYRSALELAREQFAVLVARAQKGG